MSSQHAHLETYLEHFQQLRKDKNQNKYPASTKHAAPHKSFLLLSVLDRIEEGTIRENLIALDPGLFDLFNGYWDLIMPDQRRGNIALPFYHLSSEGFWHLVPKSGSETIIEAGRRLRTVRKLKDHTQGARLDEDLFTLLSEEQPRNILRTTLIESHFDDSVHSDLAKKSSIHIQAFQYSRTLLRQARGESPTEEDKSSEVSEPARDQGFRRAVIEAYDHRCAISGLRILTSDHHTAVDAAHIQPWHVSHNDDPCNGLALNKLCHWAFEKGLLTVSPDYTILTSSELTAPYNTTGVLDTLHGRSLYLPDEKALWPDSEYLEWHRTERFRE